MEGKRTLFEFLYGDLEEKILTGFLPCGSALPSMSRLCENYQVGIRTVRDVLAALRREGLIRTEERRAAVVTYRRPGDPREEAERACLERGGAVLKAYEAMELLMPELLAFAVRANHDASPEAEAPPLRQRPRMAEWRVSSAVVHEQLQRTGNLLFNDLYAGLEVFARVPYFLEQSPLREMRDRGGPDLLMELVRKGEARAVCARMRRQHHLLTEAVGEHLSELRRRHPQVEEDPGVGFSWSAARGRDHFYTQIVRDLIEKIGTGVCQNGSFLPPEAVLAGQYGVSVSTVRRALATLNQLGFAKTYDARGTQVLLADDRTAFRRLKDRAFRRDTMLYLSGLQFMAAAAGLLAGQAYDRLDGAALRALQEEVERPGGIPLKAMIRCILEHLENQPLREILREVLELLNWGFYFSIFDEYHRKADQLNRLSLEAFQLLRAGRREDFLRKVSLCYRHVFVLVRNFLMENGLPEARRLAVPGDLKEEGVL